MSCDARVVEFGGHGVAICADMAESLGAARDACMKLSGTDRVKLIVTDPPYGNIVGESWDKTDKTDTEFAEWMHGWFKQWTELLCDGGAFYVWGGIGKRKFRPFLKFLAAVEERDTAVLANLITWSKKRAYGKKDDYLFTREELAYFVVGNGGKPSTFNIPLLATKRGYAGYDKKYPAKSEFYRRTNVWSDVTEIMSGKIHTTQKPERVFEIPIETHTTPGDVVVDMFAGSGTAAAAAVNTGRKFVIIERDSCEFDKCVSRIERLVNVVH